MAFVIACQKGNVCRKESFEWKGRQKDLDAVRASVNHVPRKRYFVAGGYPERARTRRRSSTLPWKSPTTAKEPNHREWKLTVTTAE
jgi:hypothetical protein